MSLVYAGIDGEMSSATQYTIENREIYDGGGRLIQLGISLDGLTNYKVNICWPEKEMDWQDRAAVVHQIPRLDVTTKFPLADQGDSELVNFVRDSYPDRERFIVPIGWNVASFDMPFIQFALPDFYKLLSRRTIDLNAVVYSMDRLFVISGNPCTYTTLKKKSKTYARWKLAEQQIPYTPHDAGWDAQMSILCYEYFRLVMSHQDPDLSQIKLNEC